MGVFAATFVNVTFPHWAQPYVDYAENYTNSVLEIGKLTGLSTQVAEMIDPMQQPITEFLLGQECVCKVLGYQLFTMARLAVYAYISCLSLASCTFTFTIQYVKLMCCLKNIQIREAYEHSLWDGARSALASCWDAHGWLWHGFELEGLENIPATGPALIVYYHGTTPIDVYYLLAKCLLHKKRLIHCVGDRFLFKIPGWQIIMKVMCVTSGSVKSCVEDLKKGNLLCISPGGLREAMFGTRNYDLLWGKRLGFARVALQANVPVIPMFTQNSREAFRTVEWGRSFFRSIYDKTRLPCIPIYGGFPVKLRTHIGAPITFHMEPFSPEMPLQPVDSGFCTLHKTPSSSVSDSDRTEMSLGGLGEGDSGRFTDYSDPVLAEDIRDRTKQAIEELIHKHQRLPGTVFMALVDRVPSLSRLMERFLCTSSAVPQARRTHRSRTQRM